jgi:hypothetical protein
MTTVGACHDASAGGKLYAPRQPGEGKEHAMIGWLWAGGW